MDLDAENARGYTPEGCCASAVVREAIVQARLARPPVGAPDDAAVSSPDPNASPSDQMASPSDGSNGTTDPRIVQAATTVTLSVVMDGTTSVNLAPDMLPSLKEALHVLGTLQAALDEVFHPYVRLVTLFRAALV